VTGRLLEQTVFVGVCHMQRLRQMGEDKEHARGRGPLHPVNRQPVEGRRQGGGERLGEMERDVMISHGATEVLLDRMHHCVDPFAVWICERCHVFADPLPPEGGVPILTDADAAAQGIDDAAVAGNVQWHRCSNCGRYDGIHRVNLTYGSKLLMQFLQALNLSPRIVTSTLKAA
jgi:DNA-directed RNA polymerase beta subunit